MARHDIQADRTTFAAVVAGETELRLPATDTAMSIDYADVLHLIAPGRARCCCRLVTRVQRAPVQKIVRVTILPGPGVCVGMHIW